MLGWRFTWLHTIISVGPNRAGNVYEWTSTTIEGEQVIVGGCYFSARVQTLRNLRPRAVPRKRYLFVGFRVAFQGNRSV